MSYDGLLHYTVEKKRKQRKYCREKLAEILQGDESWLIFCGFFLGFGLLVSFFSSFSFWGKLRKPSNLGKALHI